MDEKLKSSLLECETDLSGALKRFYGNEDTYFSLLMAFTQDQTINDLCDAVEQRNWDGAFMAAHALKGLSGNLGFTPLFHSLSELILLLRANKFDDITSAYLKVKNSYYHIVSAIKFN